MAQGHALRKGREMSMLSAQEESLRELAVRFDGLSDRNAALLRDAADNINELRNRLVESSAESKRLRELLQDVAICASGRYCHGCPHQYDGCDRDERLRAAGIEVGA